MDKFVSALLNKENSVILPDLGAIVVENENTGSLMFNEYLRFNDQKLEKLVLSESSMSEQEVVNSIAKYVREIKLTVEKGEDYTIYGLGRFFKNEDGKIDFEGNKFGDSAPQGEKKEIIPDVTPKQEEITSIEQTKEEDTSIQEENKSETTEEKDEVVNPVSEEKEEDTEEKEVAPIAAEPNDEDNEDNAETTDEEVVENNESENQNQEERKKKRGLGIFAWIIIALLLLFSAGSVYVALNYDEVKAKMGWDKFDETADLRKIKEEKMSPEVEIETIETETSDDETEDENMTSNDNNEVKSDRSSASTTPTTPSSGSSSNNDMPFHIIGGGFSSRSNAEKLVNEMRQKGYPSSVLGVYNGLHYVSVKGFPTRQAALNEHSAVRNEISSAWVFKKP